MSRLCRTMPWFALSAFLTCVQLGCEKKPPEPESSGDPPSVASKAPPSADASPRSLGSQPAGPSSVENKSDGAGAGSATTGAPRRALPEAFRYPAADRVVAIGDLHGDFAATERAFSLAGVIDEKGHWSGGKTVVVQTGDQLDRGDDERQIVEFLERLQNEAQAVGGRVHVLNGNHETMNVLGDFRYVTPGALDAFADYEPRAPLASRVQGLYEKRAAAFLPGGGAALLLARRPLVVMVGDTVFVHGGVLPDHVTYGIDRLNTEVSEWMVGKRSMPPAPMVAVDGPVWTRLYGAPQVEDAACATLKRTLALLSAARMVVGHTVQEKGMTGACGDQVFRIDVGLAKYYGDRPVQVLEIENHRAQILTAR